MFGFMVLWGVVVYVSDTRGLFVLFLFCFLFIIVFFGQNSFHIVTRFHIFSLPSPSPFPSPSLFQAPFFGSTPKEIINQILHCDPSSLFKEEEEGEKGDGKEGPAPQNKDFVDLVRQLLEPDEVREKEGERGRKRKKE